MHYFSSLSSVDEKEEEELRGSLDEFLMWFMSNSHFCKTQTTRRRARQKNSLRPLQIREKIDIQYNIENHTRQVIKTETYQFKLSVTAQHVRAKGVSSLKKIQLWRKQWLASLA